MTRSESQNRIDKMREEITSSKQFLDMGGTNAVAKRYDLSWPTAHKHYLTLKKLEQEQADLSQDETKLEAETNPLDKSSVASCEPSRQEVEQFFTDAEPQPVLPIETPKQANKYMTVLEPVADLLIRKNQNYGNSYHKLRAKYGPVSFLIRMSDKINRLEQLILNGEPDKVGESVDETINDIIGYSTLELDYRRNGVGD